MKLGKTFSGVLGAFVIFGLGLSLFVFADGMLVSPPGRAMYETDQKAVIFYDEGIENLILSITFQGDAGDFAWVVPTPSKPEVEKSTAQLFERLDQLTRPEYPVPTSSRNTFLEQMDGTKGAGVTVLESKQIEYYDIKVLESSDAQSLYNWLNDNGYRFPQSGNHIIEEYIQKGWFFTAIKINNNQEAFAQGQLRSGTATPLKLSFATDNPVYPLKISSLSGVQDDAPEGQITYVEGVEGGKAIQIDSDRVVATDSVVRDFSADNGKVVFYLKKRDSEPVQKIVSVHSTDKQNRQIESFSVTNSQKNVFQLIINKNYKEQYQVDLGSDFKQNEWQRYEFVWEQNASGAGTGYQGPAGYSVKFYIDNVERTMNKVYTTLSGEAGLEQGQRMVLGGDYFESYLMEESIGTGNEMDRQRISKPRINVYRKGDILIDKLEINSNQKNIFRAEFDDKLDVSLEDGEPAVVRVFEKSNQYDATDQYMYDSVGILLYVFAEKKYDVSGFDVQYAGWMTATDVENIAKMDGKNSWISPKKDKYFLTRVYAGMTPAQMTEDVYPSESPNQDSFNYAGSEKSKMIWVYLLVGLSFVSIAVMVLFVVGKERGKSFLPMKNGNQQLMKKEDNVKKEDKK